MKHQSDQMTSQKIVVLTGPTASGKTAVAQTIKKNTTAQQ